MFTRTYIVLDPDNSDASFGLLDEAEIWMVNEKVGEHMTHTGQAGDDGKIDDAFSVNDLLDTACALFKDHEYSGKVAVVDSIALVNLQNLLRRIGRDV